MATQEFLWIDRFFKPLTENNSDALGLADDVACLTPSPNHKLILSTDTSIESVHFSRHAPAAQIACKSFLSALSDLIAKGALPYGYLMNFSKPQWVDEPWMTEFSLTIKHWQSVYGLVLLGGDTTYTPGPLVISFTMMGYVPSDKPVVLRSTAQAGDIIYVTGTIGDSGLYLKAHGPQMATLPQEALTYFEKRHFTPDIHLPLMKASSPLWSASIDISDGFLSDVGHMAKASNVCAHINLETVPFSQAALDHMERLGMTPMDLITSGEDFELALTIAPHHERDMIALADKHGVPFHRVGTFMNIDEAGKHVRIYEQGIELPLGKMGYQHF